ncbi:MAG: prepilin-type N-terminal cleavage/methylation domain-containing protein [Betaproteobacteria bacterium]|nr:prepilin-type N-terminal cleavage/methylation domain-containing protein [Betaproteobacteria bacterium]
MIRITSIRSAGFTLVELIITIIIMGILSAVVMANISARAQHSVTAQADEFRRNLSHLQLLAISQGLRLRLSVNASGTNYTVVSCTTPACTSTNPVIDPATGLNFSVDLIDGVTLAPASDNLDFDSLGRPVSGAALLTGTPARSYTLSGSDRSVTVSVLPITGFAQTAYN